MFVKFFFLISYHTVSPSESIEQNEDIEFTTTTWETSTPSNIDISTAVTSQVQSSTVKTISTTSSTIQSILEEQKLSLPSPYSKLVEKPITTVENLIKEIPKTTTIQVDTSMSLDETTNINSILNTQSNSRQRVSAVKVTLPPGGAKGNTKTSKIDAPPGLNYVFDAHPNINKHHHHDYR